MCTCVSCEYTDGFRGYGLNAEKGGFANWPRGKPAGRSSVRDYQAHVKHSMRIFASPGSSGREFSDADLRIHPEPRFPAWITSRRMGDGGEHRSYPKRADTKDGWSSTAAYVEAFISTNGYMTEAKVEQRAAEAARLKAQEAAAWEREKASPTYARPASPATPAKAPRHFPEQDRLREAATIYAMPKPKTQPKPRGRPALPGRRVVIKLDEALIKRAEKIGGGNVAAGIRKALAG